MLRVGVFCGGLSIEREASFNSGRTVCDHIDLARFTPIPIFQARTGALYILPERFLHRGKISDFENRLPYEASAVTWDELPSLIDFAFIAMHGRYAEDGALQGMLELLRIPYLGSKILASALSREKSCKKRWLQGAGIMVPSGIVLSVADIRALQGALREQDTAACELLYARAREACGQSLIIKPAHEGSSLGVTSLLLDAQGEADYSYMPLCRAILHAAQISPWLLQPVIIESRVRGMEFSCIVITDVTTGRLHALPPTEIVPEGEGAIFDYEQKYMPGRGTKYTPARCTIAQQRRIQERSIQVMHSLGLTNFGRIDGFLVDDEVIIIDANTLGGMAPSSFTFLQAAEIGMSHTAFINHLIETELMTASSSSIHNHDEKGRYSGESSEATPMRRRIAVLLGGASAERETSLDSGRNVVYRLSPHRYEAIPIFLDEQHHMYRLEQRQLVKNSTREIAATLAPEQRVLLSDLPMLCDFVFIALHGGIGENGALQGALELLGLPYNGSSIGASALCMDKYKTNRFLQQQGFAVPQGILVEAATWDPEQADLLLVNAGLSYPVISKPHDDGCSILVERSRNSHELTSALQRLFASGRSCALVEEYLQGMELTVGVMGNEELIVLPPSYTVAAGGILSIEEKFLPGAGENQTPAPLPADAQALVQSVIGEVFRVVGCRGYARIDCFYQSAVQSPTGAERVVILEINTLPGLTPATCIFHQAAEIGLKPMQFIEALIEYGYAAFGVHDNAALPHAKAIRGSSVVAL